MLSQVRPWRLIVTVCWVWLSSDLFELVKSQVDFSDGIGSSDFDYDYGMLPIEEDYYYSSDGPIKDDGTFLMSPLDQLRDCGTNDQCPVGNVEKLKFASGKFHGKENLLVNYSKNPYTCRCDTENCTKYGDCCIGLIFNGTNKKQRVTTPAPKSFVTNPLQIIRQHNPWKCNFIQNHGTMPISALMTSECPEMTYDLKTKTLCSGDPMDSARLSNSLKYLLDLPVYSKRNKILYKNIYCARCHEERNENILQFNLRLKCSQEFTPEERSRFQRHSTYILGERAWRDDGNVTCQLFVDEFSSEKLEISIPEIRYCGYYSIDSCPKDGNATDRTRALCGSYTQYVLDKDNRIFKNPHCYKCHGFRYVKADKSLLCSRYNPLRKMLPVNGGYTIDGAGLNFLFDFNLSNENKYVGYEALCDESEVWDYVRQQCHPMICGKNHVLKNGICQDTRENDTLDDGKGRSDDEGMDHDGHHDHEPKDHLSEEPECFRILIHKNEYTLMEDMNNTLMVNLSNGGLLYLNESEYERWNDSTISICAKYLHHAFQSRFAPIFNYLSVGLVGMSIVFLFLHILLYILLPKMRNLPARNLFCLTVALFLSQFILLIFITATENRIVCVSAALSIHYLFLAAFFWMNSMSFDIWRTFSGQTLILQSGRNGGRGSFWKYSVFSWGIPLVIVSLAAITDFGIDSPLVSRIKPGYGETGLCWISQRLSLFIFFTLPVALIICSNLVLFSLTARAIMIQNNESNRVLSGTKDSAKSNKHSDEVRLKLYIKLALIMGLTWILGFISAFLLWDWMWYAFVVLNGLQGTFIFFAFDFKRRTLGLVREKLGLRDRKESSMTTGSASGSGQQSDMNRRGTTTSTTSTSVHNVVSIPITKEDKNVLALPSRN